MKLKAEHLKAGQQFYFKGIAYTIRSAVKRFYRNGRAKMEVVAHLTGTKVEQRFTYKADTLIEIIDDDL